MNIKIVETGKEKEQAIHLREIVFIGEQNVPPELESDSFDEHATHFIGYLDGTPIATGRLRFTDEYGKIERVCVLKNYRGKSYGAQIMLAMEAEIMKSGYMMAKLHAQTHAEKFYQRLDYETVSDVFLDANIPHVTMVKNLTKTAIR